MTDDDDNKMTKEEWEICKEAMIRASITVKMRKYDKYIEEEKRAAGAGQIPGSST